RGPQSAWIHPFGVTTGWAGRVDSILRWHRASPSEQLQVRRPPQLASGLAADPAGLALSRLGNRDRRRRSDGVLLWHAHAHQLGARGQAELAEDLAQVIVDRARAQVELFRDLPVGHPRRDQTGDLELLRRQLVKCRRVALPCLLARGAQLAFSALLPRRRS